jgi:hypothetical protein
MRIPFHSGPLKSLKLKEYAQQLLHHLEQMCFDESSWFSAFFALEEIAGTSFIIWSPLLCFVPIVKK